MMRNDSFNLILPPAMPPPIDSAVPIPFPPPQLLLMAAEKKKKNLKKETPKHQEPYTCLKRHVRCYEKHRRRQGSSTSSSSRSSNSSRSYKTRISVDSYEEEEKRFKCNSFCMFLPGFGKSKSVKRVEKKKKIVMISRSVSMNSAQISNRVSLEKFEYGSWDENYIRRPANPERTDYFDLPVEMMKCSTGDTTPGSEDVQTPVSSGFLFHKEAVVVKGVLKTSSSRSSRMASVESSPRRVQFSAPASSSSSSSSSTISSCSTSPRSFVTPHFSETN